MERGIEMSDIAWQRRQALSLCAQLPDSREDALLVLKHMHRIVEHVFGDEPPPRPVLAFERT
jgi:hypothetical protein